MVVLANPNESQLAMLEALPQDTGIAVGNTVEAFERAAPEATVIFNWSGSGALLREVIPMCPKVQWIHSRAAGVDDQLSPELLACPAPFTNGSGASSSPPLGEFVLGAVLYFGKDFRRSGPQSDGGRVEQFDLPEIAVSDRRNCRLWRHRPRRGHAPEGHRDERAGGEAHAARWAGQRDQPIPIHPVACWTCLPIAGGGRRACSLPRRAV